MAEHGPDVRADLMKVILTGGPNHGETRDIDPCTAIHYPVMTAEGIRTITHRYHGSKYGPYRVFALARPENERG